MPHMIIKRTTCNERILQLENVSLSASFISLLLWDLFLLASSLSTGIHP